ncbi:putative RNA-directed DNA polymerase [Tanacetum coccineum]
MSRQQAHLWKLKSFFLKDEDGEEMDVHLYKSMIDSLMYLTSSRPDIMFAVCACARYQVNPKLSHLYAMKRIFSLDRKSTTGGCQFLGCKLILWQCKKQTMVTNSTTKAEYVAALSCCGQETDIQEKDKKKAKNNKAKHGMEKTKSNQGQIPHTTKTPSEALTKEAQRSKSVDKGKRYKRRKESKGKDIDSGFEEVNTGFEKVNTGGLGVSTAPKRTKEQIQKEEASLAEAIRLQTLKEEETAKQVHLDALLAKRLAEEETLSEQQKKRKAQVQFETQFYTEEDWDTIKAKLEANAELTKEVLGKDLPEQDFEKRMVDLNQGTLKLSQLKFEEIKEEFEKLVKQIDTFVPMNIEATNPQGDSETDEEESVEAMNPTPLDTKSNIVANWKIFQQGERSIYQIIRANGADTVYMSFGAMLKDFTREDLIELYSYQLMEFVLRTVTLMEDREGFDVGYPSQLNGLSSRIIQDMLTKISRCSNEILLKWRQAIKEEYDALMKNGMWSLVPRASNTNVVDGNNKGTVDNIISQLGFAFALKDLGPLNYFLDDSTAFSNPMEYRQVVGSLQYVTLSRSDIAFVVNKVCQYIHASIENHWSAVKRILRYLYGNPDTSLEALSDADWAGDSDDRRSTRGFSIYLALADTVVELTWLQALLYELGIRSSSTPILWCDNLGATYLSANPIFRVRTKHMEIDYHFVREKVTQGDLRVQHISTHNQIADIFTKPLPTPRFLFLIFKLQVIARP